MTGTGNGSKTLLLSISGALILILLSVIGILVIRAWDDLRRDMSEIHRLVVEHIKEKGCL